MTKEKMTKKKFFQMILGMVIVVLLFLIPGINFLNLGDSSTVFSTHEMTVVASGETWDYSVKAATEGNNREEVYSYFSLRDKTKVKPQITTQRISFFKEKMPPYLFPTEWAATLYPQRHFFLGEKRWFDSSTPVKYAIIKVSWFEGEKEHSEIVASDVFTEDEISQFETLCDTIQFIDYTKATVIPEDSSDSLPPEPTLATEDQKVVDEFITDFLERMENKSS